MTIGSRHQAAAYDSIEQYDQREKVAKPVAGFTLTLDRNTSDFGAFDVISSEETQLSVSG